MANLASNAVKFTPRGHVLLSVECAARSVSVADVRVTVADTGRSAGREARSLVPEVLAG